VTKDCYPYTVKQPAVATPFQLTVTKMPWNAFTVYKLTRVKPSAAHLHPRVYGRKTGLIGNQTGK